MLTFLQHNGMRTLLKAGFGLLVEGGGKQANHAQIQMAGGLCWHLDKVMHNHTADGCCLSCSTLP
jgi:hypothetical protein